MSHLTNYKSSRHKMNKWFFLLISFSILQGDDDLKKISFFKGCQLYQNFLANSEIPYNIEEVLHGIEVAHQQGKELKLDWEDIQASMIRFQEEFFTKLKMEKLQESNSYLQALSKRDDILELIQDKLYYKVITAGNGIKIEENMSPQFRYLLKTLEKGQEEIVFESEPTIIKVDATIPGFAKGVLGMQIGEKRAVYVHPDLAYGQECTKLTPNALLIFEVEALSL